MIVTVNTQLILLNGNAQSGYRVKRRTGGYVNPLIRDQLDTLPPNSNSWTLDPPAPLTIHNVPDGRDYILAFWSCSAADAMTGQRAAQLLPPGPVVSDSHSGGLWDVTYKGYYVWNFGQGGGDNALLIDAFDVDVGDFIPDDFVDVTPDQNGKLTGEANNGYIDTTTDIGQGLALTIGARDVLPSNKKFGYWFNVAPLMYSYDKNAPATVGTPDGHDIVVHYNDIVVAFAMYNDLPRGRIPIVVPPATYDPWWWIKTHGGLIDPTPPSPWERELGAIATLGRAANAVSPQLRRTVLEVALKQSELLSGTIRGGIR
jgi:hypothetical protein